MANSSMPWVKLYTEFIDDPKLIELRPSAKLLFVQLICIAGECDKDGLLATTEKPYTRTMVAWRLRISKPELEKDIDSLIGAGVILETDGLIELPNFHKRQGRTQEDKRTAWRDRQDKRRTKSAIVTPTLGVTTTAQIENVTRDSRVSHAGVTPIEERREEKSREEKRETRANSPRDQLYDAIADACALDPALNGAAILGAAEKLRSINATPEQVRKASDWYAREDWRGAKGEKPTTKSLLETWKLAQANTKMNVGNVRNFKARSKQREQVDDATPEKRQEVAAQSSARVRARKPTTAVELQARIEAARARLAMTTDATSREYLEATIAHNERQLAEVQP